MKMNTMEFKKKCEENYWTRYNFWRLFKSLHDMKTADNLRDFLRYWDRTLWSHDSIYGYFVALKDYETLDYMNCILSKRISAVSSKQLNSL